MRDQSSATDRLASRRKLLVLAAGALAAPAFVRHARAAEVPRFALGIASGHPRADSVVLWTRITGADLPDDVEVRWQLARDERFTVIAAQGVETAQRGWAHSVHAQAAGLPSDRWYWYRFEALGQRSVTGRTRTAPAPDAPATLNFAIASCQRYEHGHYAAWRQMANEPLDLVLFLGDYIYEYAGAIDPVRAVHGGHARTLDQYRARYATYKSDPALQAAHAAFPWLVVWDDHEVENDYAGLSGLSSARDFAVQRAAAYQAYWEHMPFPKALRPHGNDLRIHDRWDWGTLARIHALDDRQHRSAQACRTPGRAPAERLSVRDCAELADPQRSLLGMEQERWLADGWDLQRRWNLLAQQTLMARLARSDPPDAQVWPDGWDGYAPARQRLLQSVAERKLGNLVVLGGDVHAHYVADLKLDFDAPKASVIATEFCGTSIASRGPAQSTVQAQRARNPHIRYGRGGQRGYVAFSLDAQRLQARLMGVRDPHDAGSAVEVQARFVVPHGKPGAQSA